MVRPHLRTSCGPPPVRRLGPMTEHATTIPGMKAEVNAQPAAWRAQAVAEKAEMLGSAGGREEEAIMATILDLCGAAV